MILKNKATGRTLDITYNDFRVKFADEIRAAFESYRKTELSKTFYNFKDDNFLESNFYFDIFWNFNHLSCSNWYIEKM